MRHYPNVVRMTPRWFKQLNETQASDDGKRYYPARPLGFCSISNRIRCAWLVFTGRADALIWPPESLERQP